jgi:glycoprotein endo-alpha-1,2-mannosidase
MLLTISQSALPGPAYAIGLCVEKRHVTELKQGKFDGAYTYFASDGFVWGSTSAHFQEMRTAFADRIFIPCVGPGYNDERIRPWNQRNTKQRAGGNYYRNMWQRVLDLSPAADAVGITSWNEYHEGTNIEPSMDREGYEKCDGQDYLALTHDLAHQYARLFG